MSLGEHQRLEHSRRHDHDDAHDHGDDESEWTSRHADTADILDAAAAAIASNGEREWDATAGALVSPAAHHLAHNVLASDAAYESKDEAAELAVLGDTCPICLQHLVDSVMVQPCYHVYCFECLSTWVQSLALHGIAPPTCPLCKAQFETAYANVASEYDYEVVRFHGKPQRDGRTSARRTPRQQQLQRRSLVYRRRMRLAKINGVAVTLETSDARSERVYPAIVKVRGEYDAWLERELEACIGADIDLTVLVSLIQCCLDKVTTAGATRSYCELEATLEPFLYDDAPVFVRELACFLGSRLNVEAYDAALAYCCASAHECTAAVCSSSECAHQDTTMTDAQQTQL